MNADIIISIILCETLTSDSFIIQRTHQKYFTSIRYDIRSSISVLLSKSYASSSSQLTMLQSPRSVFATTFENSSTQKQFLGASPSQPIYQKHEIFKPVVAPPPTLFVPSTPTSQFSMFDNNKTMSISSTTMAAHAMNRNPLEIFVGNLSYFCEEPHLFELFNQYATVTNVRLIRGDDKKRSLMYAFVLLSNRKEVEEISGLMNNHLFMGRQIR